jgi:hypothetical protein
LVPAPTIAFTSDDSFGASYVKKILNSALCDKISYGLIFFGKFDCARRNHAINFDYNFLISKTPVAPIFFMVFVEHG